MIQTSSNLVEQTQDAEISTISRRIFFKHTGALVVALVSAGGAALRPASASVLASVPSIIPRGVSLNSVDSWIVIHANNAITVYHGNIDSGTGVKTALAQIIAEELDAPLVNLRMIMGITGVTPDQGVTDASITVQYGGQPLRAAAAVARQQLLSLGAAHFNTSIREVETLEGHVCLKADRLRRVSYGALIGDKRFDLSIDVHKAPDFLPYAYEAKTDAPLKEPREYKIVGSSTHRIDIPFKITAQPSYVQDMRLPGMLHARILRPRIDHPAQLSSLDEAVIEKMSGIVKLVRNGSFVGVIAQREFQAIQAVDALRKSAVWQKTPLPDYGRLYEHLSKLPVASSETSKGIGSPDAVPQDAVNQLSARYLTPYQSHASIGPSCAIGLFDDNKLTIWASTQSPYPLRASLAEISGLSLKNICVSYQEGAGCYGQNGQDDVAADAALLAMAHPGHPIRIQWMRQDEFAGEAKYPAMIVDMKGATDNDGRAVLFNFEFRSGPHLARRATSEPQSDGRSSLIGGWYKSDPRSPFWVNGAVFSRTHALSTNLNPLYDIPNSMFRGVYYESPLRSGELRAVGDYSVFFAVEGFVDELSVAAQRDPVDFRLQHLTQFDRLADIIRKTAEFAHWKSHVSGEKKDGRGRGVAFIYHGSYICVVADVTVNKETGEVHLDKVYAGVDVGLVVNPDGLKNQIEGGIIQAASRTLKEEVKFDVNGITSLDWVRYPIYTFPEVPDVEVLLINRPDLPPTGAGELGSCPMAAAISNAIYDAVGVRARELPFTPQRIKALLD
jgi:nicotinate dehydrogenase subunit B